MGQKTINISIQKEILDLSRAAPELDVTFVHGHKHRHTVTHTHTQTKSRTSKQVWLKFERYSFVSVASIALLILDEWKLVNTRLVCIYYSVCVCVCVCV